MIQIIGIFTDKFNNIDREYFFRILQEQDMLTEDYQKWGGNSMKIFYFISVAVCGPQPGHTGRRPLPESRFSGQVGPDV